MSDTPAQGEGKKPDDQAQAKETEPQTPESILAYRYAPKASYGGEEEEVPPVLWLITFTDIMALMLTFFVMLYAMSSPKEDEWKKVSSALSRGLSKFDSAAWKAGEQDTVEIEKLDMTQALNLKYLKTLLEEIIKQDERLKDAVLVLQEDRLIMALPTDLLFETGSADVGTEGKKSLYAVADLFSRIKNRIEVIGHADPRQGQGETPQFSSNWQLSLSRAASVAAVLESVGYKRSVTVRGLSSARYDELPADMSEEERLSLARRVDIVIMKDDGSQRIFVQLGDSG